ncbi:SRPBCC family protein [Brachybacterium sp. YJGR34]|uniref:SRPBCC family protein n=1 Tax=Brachybacterium sp. YJGR34 TaxID=2059911 RepID=UPI000E09E420|nr:SRPBCC family protein [Brachybacterium sp. YJGR34]
MTTTDPVLRRGEGRDAVVLERHYPHPIERVWSAVTAAEHLAHWFPGAPEIELRRGGAVRFPDFAGDPAEFGAVLECEAPRRLRFTWDSDEMLFELAEDGDGTRFVLTHTFDDAAGAASFATGWEACLEGLASVLSGAEVIDPGSRRARHEELAELFGLGRPVLEETADGWTGRIERQLVCSAQTAWELFLGGGEAPAGEPPVLVVGEELRAPRAPEVVLGYLTEVRPPTLLSFDTADDEPGDAVRLELTDGTGHGARMILTVAGTDPAQQEAALEQWGDGADAIAAAALPAGDDT